MKIDARFGTGEIEVIDREWITPPVDLEDCISSRIKNGRWGYGMGADVSWLGGDFVESLPNEDNAHLFFNGIYCFPRNGKRMFKNISLEMVPSLGHLDSWRFENAEISVTDGFVNDLDISSEYGMDVVRDMMIDFGYAYCDMSTLKERYEEDRTDGEYSGTFGEWMSQVDDERIMDPDQLGEAEFDGPHWWYGDFLYSEVRAWIYDGVAKWRKEQLDRIARGDAI